MAEAGGAVGVVGVVHAFCLVGGEFLVAWAFYGCQLYNYIFIHVYGEGVGIGV